MLHDVFHKLIWLLAVCLLILSPAFAQRENVWAFGFHAGLDFNGPAPVAITTNMNTQEACASVCNASGQLQFYTNGERVWDM
ncbi:MAG: hypothetical protein EOP49_46470, partial [Sphingobacteriales bacterium]